MFDFEDLMDLDEEDMADLEAGIRAQAKIAVRTLEIFYEELKASNLPEEVKVTLLASKVNNK